MKIVSIIGARPQFVKEAIVQKELLKRGHEEVLVHTGQHFDENMSGVFFEVLEMKEPNVNLAIHSGSHGENTGRMLIEIEKILKDEEPDCVVLYGDTDSTLAGALAAAKLKLKVCHVEAGLRQEPKDMPEEINRILVDRVSDFLFVPSDSGMKNLTRENLQENAYFTGDVMYDIFLEMRDSFSKNLMGELELESEDFVLMTLHRDFNVDDKEIFEEILKSLQELSKTEKIIWPIHPRASQRVKTFGFENYLKDIIVIDPIDYLDLMGLLEECKYIITDSGGFQKESYFAGKRALVLMPDTSWIELVDEKINILASGEDLVEKAKEITKPIDFKEGIYGSGDAAEQIVKILEENL